MISTNFISEQQEELNYKLAEVQMIKDQLTLMDVRIDRYDTIIENIDKQIIPLVDEVNVAITSVKTAYDNRIAAGCKSDLHWEETFRKTYITEFGAFTTIVYTVLKNPSVREDYNYYGAKYYRRPQNQDYGSNIVREFVGTIGSGSRVLAVVGTDGTSNLLVGDDILDNIDNPVVFSSNNLPTIVGFGTTSIAGVTTDFGGLVSLGSTIIANVGVGTTIGINTGDSISLSGILTTGTTVVGFGTTTITVNNVWNPTTGTFITTSATANSLIISLPAVGTGTGTFKVGPLVTYPTLILDAVALSTATNANFTNIRTTQIDSTTFDYSNNPIDPVTVGILNSNTLGSGHKLVKVNNGSPIGPFQWQEVMTADFANKSDFQLNESERYLRTTYPEPPCGASFARYYPGNNEWPVKSTFTYGIGGYPAISTSFSYANEGDTVVSFGLTSLFGIGYVNVSSINPSAGVCNPLDAAITAAEASRDAIIARNLPKIDSLIVASNPLRETRNTMESRAFAMLQGRVYGDVEVNKLKQNLSILKSTDYTPFEPPTYYFDATTGKLVSSKVGEPIFLTSIVSSGLVLNLDAGNPQSYSGSGTNWIDISGNGNNGTLVNGPTYSNANGGSIVFGGTNDYVTSGALSGSFVSFTVIIWFYPTSVTNYQNPIDCNYSYNGSTGNIGPRLEMNNSGTLAWNYSNDTAINQNFYTHLVVSSGLSANTWYCAAITYDGNTNSSITYYNGNNTELSRTTVGTPPTGFVGTMNNITLGKGFHLGGAERIYSGRVSNTQIYNRALTASEISQNFNALRGRFGL